MGKKIYLLFPGIMLLAGSLMMMLDIPNGGYVLFGAGFIYIISLSVADEA